ncbi:MAG TPA: hypothetical protein VHU81_00295 [Thermoanaerobaculia bacterium]|jgi:hypothetical protein|nr:hypothetical protein [Thermoanaerobaculia bacterium]
MKTRVLHALLAAFLVAGSLVVRSFEAGEDPLDPSTDDEDPIATDTFSGRRVRPSR